jgi:undecaprenyl-diphosphatase
MDYFDNHQAFTSEQINLLLVGNIIAFIVALLAIKGFIGYLNKYGFKLFGWYRIVVGVVILVLLASGFQLQII